MPASELALGTSTIMLIAKALRLDFSRAQTAVAVAAQGRTLEERRAEIVARLYSRAEANLDQLEADTFRTLVRGEGDAEGRTTLDFVPPEHDQAVVETISTALIAAAKLELRNDDQKADDAMSLLGILGAALRAIPDEG